MKIYDKQIHIFELDTDEVKLLESILTKVNTIKTNLSNDEEDLINDIDDGVDCILHP